MFEGIPSQDGISKCNGVFKRTIEDTSFEPVETSEFTKCGSSGDGDGRFNGPKNVGVIGEEESDFDSNTARGVSCRKGSGVGERDGDVWTIKGINEEVVIIIVIIIDINTRKRKEKEKEKNCTFW